MNSITSFIHMRVYQASTGVRTSSGERTQSYIRSTGISLKGTYPDTTAFKTLLDIDNHHGLSVFSLQRFITNAGLVALYGGGGHSINRGSCTKYIRQSDQPTEKRNKCTGDLGISG